MFTVTIDHSDNNTGEKFYTHREYYELFDAQTVAEIECKTLLRREHAIQISCLETQYDYAVGDKMGDNLYEIYVVDNSTGAKMPLRKVASA